MSILRHWRAMLVGFVALAVTAPLWAQQISPPSLTGIACSYNASPPTLTTAFFGLIQCDSTGNLRVAGTVAVTYPTSASATLSAVASTTSSQTALAASASRKGFTLFNTDANAVYVKFGATASATSFSVQIAAGGYFEMLNGVIYTGVVDVLWVADGAGSLYVTAF